MSIKSEYEKRIEAYKESNPDCKTGRSQRIEIEGQIKDLPVYRLPIKLLTFNTKNGRFAADLENLELSLHRKLDGWKSEDMNKIKQILLDKSSHDTKVFKEDLKKRGQIEPGVITAAGVVINANRRMAILSELHKEISQDKFLYLEISILPSNISETEIYKIEARLQYAKNFKQPFGPVNELLKIEEGLKHMTKRELAALLVRDEKYIDAHINQLKLLRAYSKFAWNKVDYKKLEEQQITEPIDDIEKSVKKWKGEGRGPGEIKKLLEFQFAYIKAGATYRDIRKFRKTASLEGAKKPCFDVFSALKNKKISEESFKEEIDDVNDQVKHKVKIIEQKNKPTKLVSNILSQVEEFRDGQYKINPEIKESFIKISKIISKLIKK